MFTISVVIPVFDGAASLQKCLDALKRSTTPILECIVVDDRSSDNSAAVAEAAGAVVLRTPGTMGPAAARNLGAAYASGDLLVFIDSDVCVNDRTLGRIRARFEREPGLDALIGSYDDEPAAPGFVSQYKNLLQHYVHQNGCREATTFWSGCGAIRREVFLGAGGFDETYTRPSIEDIDFGYRLLEGGRRIALDPSVQVKHLKRWRLAALLRSDVFDRALPWTRLILRSARLPNDLNLSMSQRASGAFVLAAIGLAGAGAHLEFLPAQLAVLPLAAAMLLNVRFYTFLALKRGLAFAAGAIVLHLAYYLYSTLAFTAGAAAHALEHRRPEQSEGRLMQPGECSSAPARIPVR
jgi:cellulose synthase/poly-beta-1,6-N-acetylglucosamine synthase-like glycosyltransferase